MLPCDRVEGQHSHTVAVIKGGLGWHCSAAALASLMLSKSVAWHEFIWFAHRLQCPSPAAVQALQRRQCLSNC